MEIIHGYDGIERINSKDDASSVFVIKKYIYIFV